MDVDFSYIAKNNYLKTCVTDVNIKHHFLMDGIHP